MRRVLAATVLVMVFALGALGALGGCGGGNGDEISSAARDQLAPLVANVRRAAEAFDPDGAARSLADVSRAVEQLRARGAIGDARAQEILGAAARVKSQLALAPTTTTTTTTTTLPPVTTTPKNAGKGNGKGKGSGKD